MIQPFTLICSIPLLNINKTITTSHQTEFTRTPQNCPKLMPINISIQSTVMQINPITILINNPHSDITCNQKDTACPLSNIFNIYQHLNPTLFLPKINFKFLNYTSSSIYSPNAILQLFYSCFESILVHTGYLIQNRLRSHSKYKNGNHGPNGIHNNAKITNTHCYILFITICSIYFIII